MFAFGPHKAAVCKTLELVQLLAVVQCTVHCV